MIKPVSNPIFCALDTSDLTQAIAWARAVRPFVGGLKVGLEFFNANGPQGVTRIVDMGLPVFADLKLHDIPNTVAGGIASALSMGISIVNVHAAGGAAMMRTAADAAARMGAGRPKIIGVTVLRLATLARDSGLDGVVCAAHEIQMLRRELGDAFMLIVPGIRPVGSTMGDQKRVMTPSQGLALGADILVIGRPITSATDPAAAARAIRDELFPVAA